jgi:serine/threonine-protein kinase
MLDFGIAKANFALSDAALTRTSAMMGSPLYMSPEQLANSKVVDHRTDIWSLGAAFYEAVTGQPAFPAESLALLHMKILSAEPVRPSVFRPDLPPELEMVILGSLEKDPAKRYSSMQAVQRELERLEQRLSGVRPLFDSDPANHMTAVPATVEDPVFSETVGSGARAQRTSIPAPVPSGANETSTAMAGTRSPVSQTVGGGPPKAASKAGVAALAIVALGAATFIGAKLAAPRAEANAPPASPSAVVAPAPAAPAPPTAATQAPSESPEPAPAAPGSLPPSGKAGKHGAKGSASLQADPPAAPAVASAPVAPVAAAPEPPPPSPRAAEEARKKKRASLQPDLDE